jgi:hypothetical protein
VPKAQNKRIADRLLDALEAKQASDTDAMKSRNGAGDGTDGMASETGIAKKPQNPRITAITRGFELRGFPPAF